MGDIFKEQLVARTMTQKESMQGVAAWIGAVVAGLGLAVFIGGLGLLVMLALLWGAHFFTSRLKREHEYILTNNELDIDIIYNKQTRKSLITVDVKKMDMMASIQDDKHKDALARTQKTIDASDGKEGKETYAMIINHEGVATKLLMTPNEDMLALIYKQAPHKVMRYRG